MDEVTMTAYLKEEVTTEHFLWKAAFGLARQGVLRFGERLGAAEFLWEYIDDTEIDLFDSGNLITVPHMRLIHP